MTRVIKNAGVYFIKMLFERQTRLTVHKIKYGGLSQERKKEIQFKCIFIKNGWNHDMYHGLTNMTQFVITLMNYDRTTL